MKKILFTAFIFSSVFIYAQPKGYFGKTIYADICMNMPMTQFSRISNGDAIRQFDLSLNKVVSHNKELTFSGCYFWNNRYNDKSDIDPQLADITTFEMGLRKYKSRRYCSIAPIGRFYEIDFDLLMIKNTQYSNYGTPDETFKCSYATYLQPCIKFGRQTIFYNRIICSAGFKLGIYPVNIGEKDNASISSPGYYFLRNMINVFYSVGILL
jgi:hypothetical protein